MITIRILRIKSYSPDNFAAPKSTVSVLLSFQDKKMITIRILRIKSYSPDNFRENVGKDSHSP
jgi:hypothetical protein